MAEGDKFHFRGKGFLRPASECAPRVEIACALLKLLVKLGITPSDVYLFSVQAYVDRSWHWDV